MKNLIMLIMGSVLFVSCASTSTPFQRQMERQAIIMEHMSKGKTYVNGNFEDRLTNSGNDGMKVTAVGISVHSVSSNESLVKAAAISDGKFKLITSAPTEFKSMVQKAIGTSIGYTGDFTKVETSITAVKNLRGIEVKERDVVCKIVSEPTQDGGYRTNRECRALVTVSAIELNKAYDFTVSKKYAAKTSEAVVNKTIIASK